MVDLKNVKLKIVIQDDDYVIITPYVVIESHGWKTSHQIGATEVFQIDEVN